MRKNDLGICKRIEMSFENRLKSSVELMKINLYVYDLNGLVDLTAERN